MHNGTANAGKVRSFVKSISWFILMVFTVGQSPGLPAVGPITGISVGHSERCWGQGVEDLWFPVCLFFKFINHITFVTCWDTFCLPGLNYAL